MPNHRFSSKHPNASMNHSKKHATLFPQDQDDTISVTSPWNIYLKLLRARGGVVWVWVWEGLVGGRGGSKEHQKRNHNYDYVRYSPTSSRFGFIRTIA
jgi:hypothetical protein